MRSAPGNLSAAVYGLCALLAAPTAGLPDKWGVEDTFTSPRSEYQEGTVTAVGSWTLTDASKSWAADELAGCILQPDTTEEVYFLIRGNSASAIEVYGSSAEGHEERCYRTLQQHAQVGGTYAVLNQWTVQKIDNRWSLFDPYGNFFVIRSLNHFNYELYRYGDDMHGRSLADNLMAKHDVSDAYDAVIMEIDTVKSIGFNCLGEVADMYRTVPGCSTDSPALIPSRYLPFIAQIRISELALENTESFTVNGGSVWDAADADFQGAVAQRLLIEEGARTGGIEQFHNRTFWQPQYLTPYRNATYNVAANPWYIGLDWDEEPLYLRSEENNEHMGYRILVSGASTPRKQRAIAYLQSKYPGISQLNAVWGSSFASWSAVQDAGATQINGLLSSEPRCRDYGRSREANTAMKGDLDDIATDFWRIYCKKVRDALDTLIAVHKINFGPGYHGWVGSSGDGWAGTMSPAYLHRAAVSADGAEVYIDVIGIGDPLHGPHTDAGDMFEHMRAAMGSIYQRVGRPFWHESCWITAEADSGVAHTGTVDDLTATVLTDTGANFDTDSNFASAYEGDSSMLWVLLNPDGAPARSRVLFAIGATGAAENTLRVAWELGPGNGWDWNSNPDLRRGGRVGDPYVIVTHDALTEIGEGTYPLHIPLTQAQRAQMYVQFLEDLIKLQAPNGDYIDVGYSHWAFFDFAFRNGPFEHRNWGFETVKGNLYNGSDAVVANGEIQDCGDFVGPVSRKLNSLYAEILCRPGCCLPIPPTNLRVEPY